MSLVFDYYPNGGGEMLLALSLADFSDDDGGRIFPSVPTLARKTRQSERNVQYQLKKMMQSGFISLVEKNGGGRFKGKKYKSNEYRINIVFFAMGEEIAPLSEGCKKIDSTVQAEAAKGAIVVSPNPPCNTPLEPPPEFNKFVDDIDVFIESAVWAARRLGVAIFSEAGYKYKIRKRILAYGPNNEDKQSLIEWRAAQEQANKDARNQAGSEFKIDPSAQKKGALLFTSNTIREKFGNQ
jgi:hypothetical protein